MYKQGGVGATLIEYLSPHTNKNMKPLIIFFLLLFPQLALSAEESNLCTLETVFCGSYTVLTNQTVYAYSSTVDQTDGDPFTTASGTKVTKGIVANNCLPFGTQVRINGATYTVQDRMNSRYGCDAWDLWFESRQSALQFGVRNLNVIVMNKN